MAKMYGPDDMKLIVGDKEYRVHDLQISYDTDPTVYSLGAHERISATSYGPGKQIDVTNSSLAEIGKILNDLFQRVEELTQRVKELESEGL